jgi:hypothetical protein
MLAQTVTFAQHQMVVVCMTHDGPGMAQYYFVIELILCFLGPVGTPKTKKTKLSFWTLEPELPLSHLGMRHTFYDESAHTQIYNKVIYDDWSDHNSQSPHRVQKNIHCFCFVLFLVRYDYRVCSPLCCRKIICILTLE